MRKMSYRQLVQEYSDMFMGMMKMETTREAFQKKYELDEQELKNVEMQYFMGDFQLGRDDQKVPFVIGVKNA